MIMTKSSIGEVGSHSRGGRAFSRIRIEVTVNDKNKAALIPQHEQTKGNPGREALVKIGPVRAIGKRRGRIPYNDYHKSWGEEEGACSGTSAGRSHLPLRGKLGWMTPRPGQKRAGKRNASLGLSFPSEGPFPFLALAKLWQSGPVICSARLQGGHVLEPTVSRPCLVAKRNLPAPARPSSVKVKPARS